MHPYRWCLGSTFPSLHHTYKHHPLPYGQMIASDCVSIQVTLQWSEHSSPWSWQCHWLKTGARRGRGERQAAGSPLKGWKQSCPPPQPPRRQWGWPDCWRRQKAAHTLPGSSSSQVSETTVFLGGLPCCGLWSIIGSLWQTGWGWIGAGLREQII